MRTDEPSYMQGALGLMEDDLAEMQHWYPDAAGELARFDKWEITQSVKIRDQFREQGRWPKGTTETEKKRDVQLRLAETYPDKYARIEEVAELKAKGDKLFALLDTRRSIGQTLMNWHKAGLEPAGQPRYGQEARGQRGVGDA